MRLFVDGQPIAQDMLPAIENDGAGRLRLGRASWEASGFLDGALQYAWVGEGIAWKAAFEPPLTPMDGPTTIASIEATAGGLSDRAGNAVALVQR